MTRMPPPSSALANVDLEKLRRNLVSFVDSEPATFATGKSETSKHSAALDRVIQWTVAHAQSVGREEITAANVLIGILQQGESQASAALEEQAMTRYDATLYFSHGTSKADQLSPRRTEPAPPDLSKTTAVQAKVLLLNDDYTPMEFVVQVLECVFEKDPETAERIMLETHDNGIGTCGLYPYDVASTKVTEVLSLAREQQHPLQCVLEPGASI